MSGKWYQDPVTDEGQILSSRIRLARNLRKYPFRQRLTPDNAAKMVSETVSAVKNERNIISGQYHTIDITQFNETEQKVFIEKHIVSPEFLKADLPRGLLLRDDENVSLMINEEDHIRIQTIQAGDDLSTAFKLAEHIDDLIEESVEYAFDKDYGYLTSCPTNTGTGLRASFMIHLPVLEKTGQLKNLLPAISKFGIAIRGLYGEGTESLGSIYQISNQVTLGKSEQDIIQGLLNVTKNVIEKENWLMNKMLDHYRLDSENNICRAYGTLAYGKKISAKEAIELLSEIRMGYTAGILDLPKPNKSIYQIIMEIQPGHLQRIAGRELSEDERDIMRADSLRKIFGANQ